MALRSMLFCECDVCEERSAGFDGALYTRVDVWQILHGLGWTRRQLPADIKMKHKCPSCGTSETAGKAAA